MVWFLRVAEMKKQSSARFISFMGAGVRPLVFLSSFESTEGATLLFRKQASWSIFSTCIRDISRKNATDDRAFCVVYTKDEGGLLRHMHRGMETVYSVYGTLHCGMFTLILLFFFSSSFFFYHKFWFNCYWDYATPPLLLWSFCVAVPLSRGKHPPSPPPVSALVLSPRQEV